MEEAKYLANLKRIMGMVEVPLRVEEWMKDSYYSGSLNEVMYEPLKELFIDAVKSNKQEIIICGGIGAGKTSFAGYLWLYWLYKLCCYKDPASRLGLAPGSMVSFVIASVTAQQARLAFFDSLKQKIAESGWLRDKVGYYEKQYEIEISSRNINLLSGGLTITHTVGLNIFVGTIDEASIANVSTGGSEVVRMLHNQMFRRVRSRYGSKGKVVLLGSPISVDDFIYERMQKVEKGEIDAWAIRIPVWYSKRAEYKFNQDEKVYWVDEGIYKHLDVDGDSSDSVFFVDLESMEIVKRKPKGRYMVVPVEHFDEFRDNLPLAIMDLGAEWVAVEMLFFHNPDVIVLREVDLPTDPHSREMRIDWRIPDDVIDRPCFAHIDLGWKRDACGLAVVALIGREGGLGFFKTVYMRRWVAEEGGEIAFKDVLEELKRLKMMGVKFKKITFDGWQSVAMIQAVRDELGVDCGILSVDTSIVPYTVLRSAFTERRLDCYNYYEIIEGDRVNILERELKSLMVTKRGKVDHPRGGSKDLADALAGAVYNAEMWVGESNKVALFIGGSRID